MASVSSKIFEIFRSLKADAVPRPPRNSEGELGREPRGPTLNQETREDPENTQTNSKDEDDHEEIIFTEDDFVKEDDFIKSEKKTKFKFPFKPKKGKDDPKDPKKPHINEKNGSFSSVNTQATGPVFNIVNASGVQVGSNHVYYMSAGNSAPKNTKKNSNGDIEKDNLITLLMESKIEPTHKYITFVANNLGMNWQSFFIALGYLKGRIETLEMEKGITEARYKLLRDWVDNEEDNSLGRLTTLLWEEGERQIVRELSIIYKENKNKTV